MASVPGRAALADKDSYIEHRELTQSESIVQQTPRRTTQTDARRDLLYECVRSVEDLPQCGLVPEAGLIQPSSVLMASAGTKLDRNEHRQQADDTTA